MVSGKPEDGAQLAQCLSDRHKALPSAVTRALEVE